MRVLKHETEGYHYVRRDGYAIKMWDESEAKMLLKPIGLGVVMSYVLIIGIALSGRYGELFGEQPILAGILPVIIAMILYPISYQIMVTSGGGTYNLEFDELTRKRNKVTANKVNMDELKRVYILEDDTVMFGYELFSIEESLESGKLEIKEPKGTLKYEDIEDGVLREAVSLIKKNEILDDKDIEKLVNTYKQLVDYKLTSTFNEKYKYLLEKRNENYQPVIKSLNTENAELTKELKELSIKQGKHIEVNHEIMELIGIR